MDLACGPGFFAREFWKCGAKVIGADISQKLIAIAEKSSPEEIEFKVASADNLSFLKDKTIDKITLILAIQNIENVKGFLKNAIEF